MTKPNSFRLTRATKLLARDALLMLLAVLIVVASALLLSFIDPTGQVEKEHGKIYTPLIQVLGALIGISGVAARVWCWWVDRRQELAAR